MVKEETIDQAGEDPRVKKSTKGGGGGCNTLY